MRGGEKRRDSEGSRKLRAGEGNKGSKGARK